MKNKIYILTCICILACFALNAQQREPIQVPLSNPGQEGSLIVNVHNGAVDVTTHNKNEVEVILKDKDTKNENKGNRSGLRRIAKQNIDVSISEDDNEVIIRSTQNSQVDIAVKVPENFSLFLTSHHNGDVSVEGTKGTIEVQSHHGGIKIKDVSGSVVANTHHGSVVVSLLEVYDNTPMAFTTYHGDVDVSFPTNLNGKLKMKSSKGDIYTDFDFEAVKPKVLTTTKGSKREIKLEGWTHGLVGASGAELTFKTYHGDVIIRKN